MLNEGAVDTRFRAIEGKVALLDSNFKLVARLVALQNRLMVTIIDGGIDKNNPRTKLLLEQILTMSAQIENSIQNPFDPSTLLVQPSSQIDDDGSLS